MKAEIVSIGTELLMGELTDTNAPFLASRLPALGIQLQWVSQVGDDLGMLAETFVRGLARSDIILATGGLGPTRDDLTRHAIARALGEEMVVQQELLDHLQEYFRGRGMEMPSHNIQQATLIPSARAISNPGGTAPGWWVEKDGKTIVAMPGPPGEMGAMWENEVAPTLKQEARGEVIITRNIKTNGLSEAAVDEVISQWLGKENPYLGIYAKADGIHLRIIARAPDEEAARALALPVEQGVVQAMGPYVWGFDDETPEQSVGHLLTERKMTLATMESCTGGLLASSITDVSGSSAYFKGGLVTYSNEAKIAAGVPADLIEKHGAVSEEVASAMATAVRSSMNADIGIGITGVAGPSQLEGKPVGLVYIALAHDRSVQVRNYHMPPRRSTIKRRSVVATLIELARVLKETPVQ